MTNEGQSFFDWLTAGANAFAAGAGACLDVSASLNSLVLSGKLESGVAAGPPNYEDVSKGDAPEPIFILSLDKSICIDDGGQFADPTEFFQEVQLFSSKAEVEDQLRRLSGKRVKIEGDGFAAHTGHHHRPLVVNVRLIQ